MTSTILGYAFIGGLLPSFIWLYFLLKEDSSHPEPKKLIALTFIAGMVAVALALPLENWSCLRLAFDPVAACLHGVATWQGYGFKLIIGWALIEELLKYGMVAALILWRPAVDEAPDYVIYMITVALGFASAENMLFVNQAIAGGNHIFTNGLFTENIRFLGSTLLHVTASATIGFALAFSDYDRPHTRLFAASLGLILAVALHTAFNTLMINEGTSGTLTAFFLVWTVAVILFAAFEVLKYFQYRKPLT